MSENAYQATKDAVALTTLLLHEKNAGAVWSESLSLAESLSAERGAAVMMAQAHFLIQTLNYIVEVSEGVAAEGLQLDGIPGGITPENILREIGRQILESQALGEGS